MRIHAIDPEIRRELLRPGASRRLLPLPTQAMLTLLQKHGVERYRYSPAIGADLLLQQRLVEGSYPALPDRSAPVLVLLPSDALDTTLCTRIDRLRGRSEAGDAPGAVLARCD